MLKISFTIVCVVGILLTGKFSFSQEVNVKVKDSKHEDQEVLVGYCTREGLIEDEFGEYFESDYNAYEPSIKYVDKLKEKINRVEIKIVFGSWCSDSELQVPRFYKVLDLIEYNEKNLKVIGVNRDKKGVIINIDDLNIVLVPTFIVYQDGTELGRIIETPKNTLEKDLWKIVKTAEM